MKIWISIFVGVILIVGCLFILSGCSNLFGGAQAVPEDYITRVQTGGEIEAKYLAMGPYEVESQESSTFSELEKFIIHYPKSINEMDKVPVVIFLNGTGVPASKYLALQKHLASWGFITIGNEEPNSFYGEGVELAIRWLKLIDTYTFEDEPSPLKGHIDFENIGVTGHSQGGIGVINGITIHPNSNMVKAAVVLSSTETDAAKAFLWDSDASLIKAHTLMLGSMGEFDSKLSPLEDLIATFDKISGVDKVLARRKGVDHGEMLYYGDGYVTAWFMYYLKGDIEAGKAFFGEDAEIFNNDMWQDTRAVSSK